MKRNIFKHIGIALLLISMAGGFTACNSCSKKQKKSEPQISEGTFNFSFESLFPTLFGFLFAVIGGLLLNFGTKPIVFEKANGYFWKGPKNPETVYSINELKSCIK